MKNVTLILSACALGAFALTPDSPAQGEGSETVVLPNRFTANTPAVASEVNANFDALATAVDGVSARAKSAETRLDSVEVAQGESDAGLAALTAEVGSLSSTSSDLADTVATLPRRPANTIVVATADGDFTSVVEALNSITDASAENPYLVQVMPGTYAETDVSLVQEGVHLRGAGPEASILSVNRSDTFPTETGAAIRLLDGARLSSIGVRNTGATATSIGVIGFDLTRATVVDNVAILVDGAGGNGHFGMHVSDSNLIVRNSRLEATGATALSSAFGSVDGGGPFAQPLIEDSHLIADDFAAQISKTAMTVRESILEGDESAVSATISGVSHLEHCQLVSSGFNPVYTTTGSATLLSAASQFQGGNPFGLSSSFVYVHCYKSNFQPIVNGSGSSVQ